MNELIQLFGERIKPLEALSIEVSDDSAAHAGHVGNTGGGHLSATIVSEQFRGLSKLARHRAVYKLVADLMPHRIHALSLITKAPNEA